MRLADLLERLQAIHARHPHVHDHQVRHAFFEHPERLCRIAGDARRKNAFLQFLYKGG